jgi:hypothetical protein
METNNRSTRRVRIEQGIYPQPAGKYTVCLMAGGRPRFRTVGYDLEKARAERAIFIESIRAGEPRRRSYGSRGVAGWWIERYERRVKPVSGVSGRSSSTASPEQAPASRP